MEQNPYESPKEVNSLPAVKAGAAFGTLLLLSIPAGCICGGITCYTVGETGERTGVFGSKHDGWLLGIPIALGVVVLIPFLGLWLFGKRKSP